jgi:hypothetical protein
MVESLRDKTRDELAYNLNSLGVKAETAERGRPEDKIDNSWWQRSLGVIDIPEGLVRWINILKKDRSKDSPPRWWIVFCIPDERPISKLQAVKISTARKKTFPLFGKVVDVKWKGKDCNTGLIDTISNDEAVKDLAQAIGNMQIRSYAKEFQGWVLVVDRKIKLTNQDWSTIQKMADYMLSSSRIY